MSPVATRTTAIRRCRQAAASRAVLVQRRRPGYVLAGSITACVIRRSAAGSPWPASSVVQQAAACRRLAASGVRQGRPEVRLSADDPAEPEQARPPGRRAGRHLGARPRWPSTPSCSAASARSRRRRPSGCRDHADDQVQGGPGDAAVQQPPGQAAPAPPRACRRRSAPGAGQALVEQVGDREQLLAEYRGGPELVASAASSAARAPYGQGCAAGALIAALSRGRPVAASCDSDAAAGHRAALSAC